jgi:hypothetical protein
VLGEQARKRHYHKTEKGKVLKFVVQLEVKVEDTWKPVIRYDCAHDFSHIDRYNAQGKQSKEELHLPYAESLTLADEDINVNWEQYRVRFFERRVSMNVFEKRNSLLGMEFDRFMIEHPDYVDKIPDNAQIILLLEGDNEFNEWSAHVGKEQAEHGQPLVYVTIKKLGPARSRIEDLSLVMG